jgi:tetratricopeptide (TPR) repeat protein
MEGGAYQAKSDAPAAQAVFESLLTVNPKSLAGNMTLGELITQQTGDKDFDKEKKLAEAEKYLKAAMDILGAGKPNPLMSDQDWEITKGVYSAEVHNDLGLIARFRKNYDVAVQEFTTASTMVKEPAYDARLADALQLAGKNKESIAVCDKVLADPQLHPTIKALVTQVRINAVAASTPPGK